MVLKRKPDYGPNAFAYHFPSMPRAPRSTRRRSSLTKTVEDSQICAFELLATVAGKLLLERDTSSSSNATAGKNQLGYVKDANEQEQQDEVRIVGKDCFNQEKCRENHEYNEKDLSYDEVDKDMEQACRMSKPTLLDDDTKLVSCSDSSSLEKPSRKLYRGSPTSYGKLFNGRMHNEIKAQLEVEKETARHLVCEDMVRSCISEDQVDLCIKYPSIISSDTSADEPTCMDLPLNDSFFRRRNDVNLGCRDDDDEKFSGCNTHSTSVEAFRAKHCMKDRKIKKLLSSKYWKAAPKLQEFELCNTDGKLKHVYPKRKTSNQRERSHLDTPLKKRKLFDQSPVVSYDGGSSAESISNSPEKEKNEDNSGSANGVSSSVVGPQASSVTRDSHVKFQIKSFSIPEVFIELPETATINTLKKMVMEAVTSILENGLNVGVVLQGKKVRDDKKTLLQTGIACNENLDRLSFILEPNSSQVSQSIRHEDSPSSPPCDRHQLLSRCLVNPVSGTKTPDALQDSDPLVNSTEKLVESNHEASLSIHHEDSPPSPPYGGSQLVTRCPVNPDTITPDALRDSDPYVSSTEKHVESNHELVPACANTTLEPKTTHSKALVPILESAEVLAVVPMNQNTGRYVNQNSGRYELAQCRRSELAKRRIRRPFSVTEVEALVQAVEKLGTGRWRDVKICAFDNANHRTYVDLKDKWKTLVHTAQISPQQRRGEPVPQELLDRVLRAHAYWTQYQARQGKRQLGSSKIDYDAGM
ncbi:hypothetical protein RJ641_036059 [Dillenia turbinata]|uniref:Uncharacterized protein n=1 Tax=Dillenia turbinata TaxID=194707 RepID=A0AAN8ZFZ3_9MAGN